MLERLATVSERPIDLSGADLQKRDLRGADLRDVLLADANMCETDLENGDLRGADLREVELYNANLRNCKLPDFVANNLAGADMAGARVPQPVADFLNNLSSVKSLSESAWKAFLVLLTGCLYCWLTIASTTDLNLITNRAESPLPIIQTSIPVIGFYLVAPILLLCIYFYFHVYLQRLWEELAILPAVFPDGRSLFTKVDPWLINDVVKTTPTKCSKNRSPLSVVQGWLWVTVTWWMFPVTMLFFWARYLRTHEWLGIAVQSFLLVVSVVLAVTLRRLSKITFLRPYGSRYRQPHANDNHWGSFILLSSLLTASLVLFFDFGALQGIRSKKPLFGDYEKWSGEIRTGPTTWIPRVLAVLGHRQSEDAVSFPQTWGPKTWVPRTMAFFGYPPFAQLDNAELSQKKQDWHKDKYSSEMVIPAKLNHANLRYAKASSTFLQFAQLEDVDLTGSDLSESDLRGAYLRSAHLAGANLFRAQLAGAILDDAHLEGANLWQADLSNSQPDGTHFDGATLDYANLQFSRLRFAGLARVELTGANLNGADLRVANLEGANFKQAQICGADLRETRGVDADQLKKASAWRKAFYSDNVQTALGLKNDVAYQTYLKNYLSLNNTAEYLLPNKSKEQQAFVGTQCNEEVKQWVVQ